MDLAEMYRLINKKEKSAKDLMEFVDFMFDNKDKVDVLEDVDKKNFKYHFDLIPTYTKEMLGNLRNELINEVAIINIRTRKILGLTETLKEGD